MRIAFALYLITFATQIYGMPPPGVYPLHNGGSECGTHVGIKLALDSNSQPGILLTRIEIEEDIYGNNILLPKEHQDFIRIGTYTNNLRDQITIKRYAEGDGIAVFHREAYTPGRDPDDYGFTLESLIEIHDNNQILGVLWRWSSQLGVRKPPVIRCIYNLNVLSRK